MYRPFWGSVCCLLGLVLAACSEQPQQENPGTPSFATNPSNTCASNVFNPLIAGYFSNPQQQTAQNYKDAMLAALPGDSATARTNGFNLMREIATASKAGASNFDAGSELTRETLKCIFDVTDTNVVKGFATLSFVTPVNRAAGGGYDVRAGSSDPTTDPVLALSPGTTQYLSGVALPPNPPAAADSWAEVASERVLIYGFPGSGSPPTSYDWSAIPRRATFNPGVIVGLCISDGTPLMVKQANVGVLAFQEASYFLDPDGNGVCTASVTSAMQSEGIFALGQRLREWGRAAFGVTALQASMVSPGLTGGNAGSLKSLFDDQLVPSAQLTFVPDPPFANVQAGQPFAVQVQATAGGLGVNGDCITLTATTNNGTNTKLVGQHKCPANTTGDPSSRTTTVNNVAGVAQFCVNDPKTGTIQIVAIGNIEGRGDTPVTVSSKKLNVKPSAVTAPCP